MKLAKEESAKVFEETRPERTKRGWKLTEEYLEKARKLTGAQDQ
jgi:hypothetical protein